MTRGEKAQTKKLDSKIDTDTLYPFVFDIRHGQFYLDFEIENTKINIGMTTILNLKFKSWT